MYMRTRRQIFLAVFLTAIFEAAALETKLLEIGTTAGRRQPSVRTGIVATGDVFIESSRKKKELRRVFSADAVEMEGAAVAHVCRAMNVPCLVIRSISDSADAWASADVRAFAETAAANSAALVRAMLARLATSETAAGD